MPQWEYRQVNLSEVLGDWVDALNIAGDDGWELVAITANSIAYLKRQVQTPSTTQRKTKTPAST
jgi:hypothetical protein